MFELPHLCLVSKQKWVICWNPTWVSVLDTFSSGSLVKPLHFSEPENCMKRKIDLCASVIPCYLYHTWKHAFQQPDLSITVPATSKLDIYFCSFCRMNVFLIRFPQVLCFGFPGSSTVPYTEKVFNTYMCWINRYVGDIFIGDKYWKCLQNSIEYLYVLFTKITKQALIYVWVCLYLCPLHFCPGASVCFSVYLSLSFYIDTCDCLLSLPF